MVTGNPHKFEIHTLWFFYKHPINPCNHLECTLILWNRTWQLQWFGALVTCWFITYLPKIIGGAPKFSSLWDFSRQKACFFRHWAEYAKTNQTELIFREIVSACYGYCIKLQHNEVKLFLRSNYNSWSLVIYCDVFTEFKSNPTGFLEATVQSFEANEQYVERNFH